MNKTVGSRTALRFDGKLKLNILMHGLQSHDEKKRTQLVLVVTDSHLYYAVFWCAREGEKYDYSSLIMIEIEKGP